MMRELFSYLSCFDVFLCCFSFLLFLDDDEIYFFALALQAVSGAAPPIKISLFGLFQARDTKEVIAP